MEAKNDRRVITALCTLALFYFSCCQSVLAQTKTRPLGVRNSAHVTYKEQRLASSKKKNQNNIDPKLLVAVNIAVLRARTRSINRCWRYVKKALVEAEVLDQYPGTKYAKQAGHELVKFGFQPIEVKDPFDAPVGSILVYGGRGPGHVEFRTEFGFVSDFISYQPSPRPLIGVFVKAYTGS